MIENLVKSIKARLNSESIEELRQMERSLRDYVKEKLQEGSFLERIQGVLSSVLPSMPVPSAPPPRASPVKRPARPSAPPRLSPPVRAAPKPSAPAFRASAPAARASAPAARASAPAKLSASAKRATAAKQPAKPKRGKASRSPHEALLKALEAHPSREALLAAGSAPNQVMRSLIPLYLGKSSRTKITSGVTSKFWSALGIKYAAPNAAKMLRQNAHLARRTATGVRLTPAGVAYVEAAVAGRRSS